MGRAISISTASLHHTCTATTLWTLPATQSLDAVVKLGMGGALRKLKSAKADTDVKPRIFRLNSSNEDKVKEFERILSSIGAFELEHSAVSSVTGNMSIDSCPAHLSPIDYRADHRRVHSD